MDARGFRSRELVSLSPEPVETRGQSLDVLAQAYGFRLGRAGVSVFMAENQATIAACVGAICTGLSSLPIWLYEADERGRTVVTDHPVARLLRQPNRHQPWPNYLEMTLASTLLAGNGVSVVDFDSRGAPIELRPVRWQDCAINMMASGRLAYDVTFPSLFSGSAAPVRYFDDAVLHIRDRSDDGLIGRSRLSRTPDAIGNAASLQEFTANFWSEGLAPSAALKHPKTLSEPARTRLRSDMEQYRGAARRKMLLLEEGTELTLLSVSPEAAEVLASRRFTVAELCRIFQVPPIIVGDLEHSTLQNSQQATRWFAQLTLAGWARKIEAEIARALLPGDSSLFVQFDMSELLRGDPEAQMASAIAAVQAGVISANEARLAQGFPARDDGDVLRMLPGEPIPTPAPAEPAQPAMPAPEHSA